MGMIFQAHQLPFDDNSQGAEISFDPMGYVKDEDTEGHDHDALLKDIQVGIRAQSKERVERGYEAMELIGWAEPPRYLRAQRKL